MTEPLLVEANQICRQHEGQWLLRDVNFEIKAGQRSSLVGSSGSGKTLLLRALAMLDPIDSGSIQWQGRTLSGSEIPTFRRQVIYLQQRASAVDGDVEAWLRQPFELKVHQDSEFQRTQIIEQLQQVGRSAAFLKKQHRDLSGGESQIAALLRAIQLAPQVLLLDEPTAALDEETSRQAESLIQNWFEADSRQRSYVWVTHNAQQADRVAQHVIRISHGQILAVPA